MVPDQAITVVLAPEAEELAATLCRRVLWDEGMVVVRQVFEQEVPTFASNNEMLSNLGYIAAPAEIM